MLDLSLQGRNGNSESLGDMAKVTELINGKSKIHTRSAFFQNSCWGRVVGGNGTSTCQGDLGAQF